jgi:hypothetical protein
MITRRHFRRTGAIAGASLFPPWQLFPPHAFGEVVPGGTLDPTTVPKYVMPLLIPPVMPRALTAAEFDYYEIGVRQFRQQILPPSLPKTMVWGYGSLTDPRTF